MVARTKARTKVRTPVRTATKVNVKSAKPQKSPAAANASRTGGKVKIAAPPQKLPSIVSHTMPSIQVTQKAYDLAARLVAAKADKTPVAVTSEMLGPALSELVHKKIVKREGWAPGRYAKLGQVKLLVLLQTLVASPNRVKRMSRKASRAQAAVGAAVLRLPLSIEDLAEFAQMVRRHFDPLLLERLRSIDAKIAELQRYLAISKGDDFRNTMAMANAELRRKDELERDVYREVLDQLNPGVQSPLYGVWTALRA